MGITSISQIGKCYAQNVKKESEYFEKLNDGIFPIERGYYLSNDDLLRRHVITRIMCDFELDFNEVEKLYSIDFHKYFESSLEKLNEFVDDGLLILSDHNLKVTDMGRFMIRNIAMNFDAYIETSNAKFSRTV